MMRIAHIFDRLMKIGKPMEGTRLISFSLALLMLFNVSASSYAESAQSAPDVVKKTVTWTLDSDGGSLSPLTSERTVMADQGNTLVNAEGVVNTQVQSVYRANQTLVSLSLAGTSFSFAPLMLDDYYPVLSSEKDGEVPMLQTEEPMPTEATRQEDEETVQDTQPVQPNPSDTPSPVTPLTSNQPGEGVITDQVTETPQPVEPTVHPSETIVSEAHAVQMTTPEESAALSVTPLQKRRRR